MCIMLVKVILKIHGFTISILGGYGKIKKRNFNDVKNKMCNNNAN